MTHEPARPAEARALENSEQEWISRFAGYAAEGELYPQTEGSPLMEFSAGGRVLYLFDRTGPYTAQPGPARVIVHGLLNLAEFAVLAGDQEEQLMPSGISTADGVGQVMKVKDRSLIVRARLPVVLSAPEGLPAVSAGQWVAFKTLPPLHGFLVK